MARFLGSVPSAFFSPGSAMPPRPFPLYGFLILLAVFTFRDWGTGQLEWDFWVDPLICIAAFAFFSRQQS